MAPVSDMATLLALMASTPAAPAPLPSHLAPLAPPPPSMPRVDKPAELAPRASPPAASAPVRTDAALVERAPAPPPPSRGGRPSLLAQHGNEILNLISKGYPPVACFLAAGVSKETLYSWRRKASNGIEPYAGFFRELVKREAQAKIEILGYVRAAAAGGPDKDGVYRNNPQSATWLLKNFYPDEFGDATTVRLVKDMHEGPVAKIDPRNLSDEELVAFKQLIIKASSNDKLLPAGEDEVEDAEFAEIPAEASPA